LKHSWYYPGKNWSKILDLTSIETHINPETNVMDLDARTSYSHEAVSMSKGMTEDIVGVGSKYLAAYKNSDQIRMYPLGSSGQSSRIELRHERLSLTGI
jgi:hypothetical protein